MGTALFTVLKKYLLHPKALIVYLIIGVVIFTLLFTYSVKRTMGKLQIEIQNLNQTIYEKDNQVIHYSNTIVYDNQIFQLSNYFNEANSLLEKLRDEELTYEEKTFISNTHNTFYFYRMSIYTNYKN